MLYCWLCQQIDSSYEQHQADADRLLFTLFCFTKPQLSFVLTHFSSHQRRSAIPSTSLSWSLRLLRSADSKHMPILIMGRKKVISQDRVKPPHRTSVYLLILPKCLWPRGGDDALFALLQKLFLSNFHGQLVRTTDAGQHILESFLPSKFNSIEIEQLSGGARVSWTFWV